MAKYQITSPDGQKFEITAPDEATQEEVMQYAQKQFKGGQPSIMDTGFSAEPQYTGNWFDRQNQKRMYQGQSSDQVLQGATFGFGDELLAGMHAPIGALENVVQGKPADIGGEYSRMRDKLRGQISNYQQENPKTAFVSNIAGGAVAGAPAFKGLSSLNPYAASAITGAGYGALSGAGYSNGDWGDKAAAAGTGLVAGGLLGVAIPLLIGAGGKGWQYVKNTMGWNDIKETSIARVLKAMEDDGLTPEQAGRKLDEMARMGKPGVLADQGENLQSLGAYVSKQPGPGRATAIKFLEDRQSGQPDRLTRDVRRLLSGDDVNYWSNVDDLLTKRSVSARPAYEKALGKQGVWNERVQNFLDDPIVKHGLNKGLRIQRLEALAEGRQFNPNDYAVTSFNEAGEPVLGKVPNMRTLDTIKKGLDDILESYRDKTSGKLRLDQEGRAIEGVRKAFVNELDKVNPDYAAARQSWAGPTESLNALQKGRAIFNGKDADDIERIISGMSDGEKEFFKVGVARAIQDKMDARVTGANKAKEIFGTPKKEKALSRVFGGQKEYQRFKKAVEAESKMHSTYRRATGGSPTQPLQAEQDALGKGVVDAGSALAQGRYLQAIGSVGRSMTDRLQGLNKGTTDEIAKMLFADNPQALAQYGQSMMKAGISEAEKRQILRGLLGLYAPSAGVTGGLLAAPSQ